MKKITFLHTPEMALVTPAVPASKALPEWYKKAQVDIDLDGSGPWNTTFKACMPFLDAMTQGYIIPLWCDLYVSMKTNAKTGKPEPVFTWNEHLPMPQISSHWQPQVEGIPDVEKSKGNAVFKFMNPWIVRTPPGYSSLIVAPLNNAHPYFQMFSAVVATDQYFNGIQFPFTYIGPDDWEGTIPMGTPLMQIIPFKRDDFEHQITPLDESDNNMVQSCKVAIALGFRHVYKRLWRRPVKSI